MRQPLESILRVDLQAWKNNHEHHTDELTRFELIVRRGQSFNIALYFGEAYKPDVHDLTFTASTGTFPDEKMGTKSVFGVPDLVNRSFEAKSIWKAEIDNKNSSPETGRVALTMTPPADAPVGKYSLFLNQSGFNKELATLTVLFNPWCTEDSVYMEGEAEKQEYVMNESGVIYRGSSNRIFPLHWDYGQFEHRMVEICLLLLDKSPKHFEHPARDESSRYDPIYVSRVVSAMVNSAGDLGVLVGRWSGSYSDGVNPTRWSGSYPILKRWYNSGCRAVKYGQCWVFAGVMCSVLRLLGIPCRVITNFDSAHDSNKNLTIDIYHADYGVREIPSGDSVWNFHVWVEAWMKRPDLPSGHDGWQVVDPTPQERSDGVFCCGPAPVEAVLNGLTHLDYDVPFVFAEVNADRIDWLVKADGSKIMIWRDTGSVGQNISTKSVGFNIRQSLTKKYKFEEGTVKERRVFRHALNLNDREGNLFYNLPSRDSERNRPFTSFGSTAARTTSANNEDGQPGISDVQPDAMVYNADSTDLYMSRSSNVIEVERVETDVPKVSVKFEEVSKPVHGKDVKLNLVLHSEAPESRQLSINISVNAKSYTGSAHSKIRSEQKKKTLRPGKDLCIPVVVPFSQYWKPMLDYDAMNVSAVVSDSQNSEVYLAVDNVVLVDPPIEVKVLNEAQVKQQLFVEMAFTNPVSETLKNCSFTVSGSGLLDEHHDVIVPDLDPNKRVRVKFYLYPYRDGQKTLVVDFNCSVFRDIKSTIPVNIKGITMADAAERVISLTNLLS